MGSPGKYQRQERAYLFFNERAADRNAFSVEDIADYCGWDVSTPKTYLTKKWKDFLSPAGSGRFTVKPEFVRITKEQFLGRASQKNPIYTEHIRTKHDYVVIFEFYLALTGDDKLKESLDELLFADGLENRIREIGLEEIERLYPKDPGASDDSYITYLIEQASVFRGYSISHENGRFRTGELMPRSQAGALYASGGRYLADETTAVVKFVIPCSTGSDSFKDMYELSEDIHETCSFYPDDLEQEVRRIRGLFFILFVEAIVRNAESEDDIWLVESGVENRVYHWRVP